MQVLGSRRGGVVTLAVVVAALVAATAFVALQLAGRGEVAGPTPGPGSSVARSRPLIAFSPGGAERLGDLRVLVDGRDRTARIRMARDGRVALRPPALGEGRHRVEVRYTSTNVFSRSVERAWEFQVDTTVPTLALKRPRAGQTSNRRRVAFTGTSEPRSMVRVAWKGGSARARVGPRGHFRLRTRLPEGRVTAAVTVADRAGNVDRQTRRVGVDTTAPALRVSAPAAGERLTETDQPLVYGNVGADDPRALRFGAIVNGREVVRVDGRDVPASSEATTGTVPAGATEGASLSLDGRRFALAVGTLPQGRNTLTVWTRDPAGNIARRTMPVLVDSTEQFGTADLVEGARGADVRTLQSRLRDARLLRARPSGRLDARTVKALTRYQKRFSVRPTGVLDAATRKAMVGRIVISLSQRRLRLIRDGRVARAYPVAVGQPAYPTPTGRYEVIVKQVDPTWSPPDSPWAAGLGPLPPGPGNPLGTRWIGTSAPAIGIHGTYAESSIGTAASHGCIRMRIPDVEELYEEVSLGMEVEFVP